MEGLALLKDGQLEQLGQRVVHGDHAAQPPRRLATDQRIERDSLLLLGAQAQRLEQQLIGGYVFRIDQRGDQAINHLLHIIGPAYTMA